MIGTQDIDRTARPREQTGARDRRVAMTDHATPGAAPGAPRRPDWSPGGSAVGGPGVSGRPHYSPPPPRNRAPSIEHRSDRVPRRSEAPVAPPMRRTGLPARGVGRERGLAGWQALALLLVLAGIGGLFDLLLGTHIRGGFNYGIIVASLVAILAVRRGSMFPIVVAPPIVYFVASAVLLLVRSRGLSDRGAAIDIAINWLVYGFPAIAAATAIVLIVAGVRLIANR